MAADGTVKRVRGRGGWFSGTCTDSDGAGSRGNAVCTEPPEHFSGSGNAGWLYFDDRSSSNVAAPRKSRKLQWSRCGDII